MGKLDLDDVALAICEGEGGVIEGRTRLQKIAYFVTYVLSADMAVHPGFLAHHYGPYSSALSTAAASAVVRGVLHETTEVFSSGAFLGHDMAQRRYAYRVTPRGEKAVNVRRQRAGDAYERAVNIAQQIKQTAADYRVLSYAAKAHYVLRQEGKAITRQAILHRATTLGWDLRPDELEAGVEFLRKLELVTEDDSKQGSP